MRKKKYCNCHILYWDVKALHCVCNPVIKYRSKTGTLLDATRREKERSRRSTASASVTRPSGLRWNRDADLQSTNQSLYLCVRRVKF